MIKLFSNKTNSPKIKVESKFLINKTIVNTSSLVTGVTKNDLLFIKLTFSGLQNSQKVSQLMFYMMCYNAYANTGVKVIKCNNTDISNSNIKSIAQSITGEEEVFEKTIIYGHGHSLNKPGAMPFSLDLTNILKNETSVNPTIMIAVSFPYGTTSDFGMYSPEALAENSEICIATMTEVSGLSGLYKYDEHDFGRCGKVSVNLATGKPIYSLDVMTSVGKKFPINFSLYQNTDKSDSLKYFRNKIIPNFHYRIYPYDDYYVVEDPTGFKNYYKKVEYTAENKDEVLKNLGIKHEEHLTNSAILYQSYLDYSYMYVQEGSTESIVHLYDKADTCISFIVSLTNARISTIETSLGSKLTYTWNSSRLEKITNSDGEEMLVDYTSDGHIHKVSFPSMDRYIDFTEDTTNQTLNIRTYYHKKSGGSSQVTSEETINEAKLYFSSNVLTKILDVATGYYISLTSNSQNKVTSAGMYNASGTTKNYVTTYTYFTKFTKTTDLEGNSLFYHFDNYGRIKTIMDNQARTITYNYDELENGESKNLIGLSKTQNNSRNLLENHSFEDENAFFTNSIAWKKAGEGLKTEILTDGVLGEKCLKLTTASSDETSIYQSIVHPKSGNYVLKGFIKHPNVTNITSSNVKVGIRGTYQIEETVTVNVSSNTTTTKTNTVTYSYNEYALLDFEKLTWYSFETPVVSIPAQAHHITMTVELVVDHIGTEIYMDDLQLTNSSFFTRYNLIENGYMEFADSDNRPHGWSFQNLDNEDAIAMIEEDNIHSSMLGNHVMRIAPGDVEKVDLLNDYKMKRMFKSIPVTGLAGEQFIFSVFAKGCVTNNTIFRAFIKFVYENKDPVYSQFDFDKHFDNWQMLTRSVVAEDNFTEVVVGIEYDGGAEVLLDCFQLYKDSFGRYYNYDSRGNITETISGDGTATRISYDDNNKVDEIYSSDGSHFKYNYDSKGRLSKVTDLNGNKIDLAYDSNDRIISTTITQKNGERIINSTTYDDVNNKEKTINEFGKEFTTSMDYLNRVISQIDSKGLETEFTYNHKSELEQLYAVVDDVTNKNSLTYDSFGNTKTIRAENGTFYSLTYDTFGRLEQIKCNGYNLERYQYDSLVNGYKKGQLLKKTLGTSEYYEFNYNDLGQVTKVKLNGELIATYSYDENGNVYELKDEKANVSSYFTYDLQGNLIKKKTSKDDSISYTYDNLGNIQKVSYNINSAIRSIDYEYEYELNEYTKEGYFNRLASMFGDEIVVSGQGPKGQFGAKHIYATYSSVDDAEMGMKVFHFVDKYDFINYEMDTFNSNRTSGVVNGKIYSKKSWDSRFRYNKTFYMFIKPTGSYAKENLFTLGSLEIQDNGYHSIEIFSHLCVNSDGKIAYYPSDSNIIASTDNTIKLNNWNLVGIKLFKKDGKHKAQIILNNMMTSEFEISENVDEMNYLLVANQHNLITNTSSTTSSGASNSTTSNLTMPFKVCLMSFGAYDYTKDEFTAIYNEGLKYLFKGTISKSNATIYYDEKAYKGFDVITLNGSLESTKGLKPVKIATIDKSYRFDKTRIFKYDEELQKHVFGCYDGIVNLTPGTKTALAYKLPLTTEGTIALRFKYEESQNMRYQIFSLNSSASDTEYLGLYIDDLNELKLIMNNNEMISTNAKFIGNKEWHHFILRFKNNKLQVYLDQLNRPLFTGTQTINFTNKTICLGNDRNCSYPLNGCIEMFAFKESFATDEEVSNLFEKGKTIIVRNQLDSLGRVTQNKILINDDEYETTYRYYKTQVASQTFHNGDKITYSYDAMNNITTKSYLENGMSSQIRYTYDQLGRLQTETFANGEIEKFTYYQNGNIKYREVIQNNEVIVKEEYIYNSTVKDRLLQVKDLISGNIVQNITYDSKNLFNPKEMIIKGVKKSLKWNGNNLLKIGNNEYEYNTEGIRISKKTDLENTSYDLEGINIVSLTKNTSNETTRLDFIYNACGLIVGLSTNEGNYFYMRDITGNIIGLIDQEGEYVVKYTYNAWGKILEKQILKDCIASRHNPFVYKGYFLDEETGFYYLNSRYYSPELHRFISVDNFNNLITNNLIGLNLYCYCLNNPIMYFDYFGNTPLWVTIITTAFEDILNFYSFALKISLKSLKQIPMEIAKKLARKGGHVQSARSIIRARQSTINKTRDLMNKTSNFAKKFGKAMLIVDIIWTTSENILSGNKDWFTDSIIDAGISIGIYALGCIPYVGWAIAIVATIATICFDDEIEEFKDFIADKWTQFTDWISDGWNEFWSFSWV